MAACKSALVTVLLGLLMATYCVAAEASSRCGGCQPGGGVVAGVVANVAVEVDLQECASAVEVVVRGAVAAVAGVKEQAVECAGGVVTKVAPVVLHLVAVDVAYLNLKVLGYSKVLEVSVVVDLAKVVKVVNGVRYASVKVVEDVKAQVVIVSCLGVHVHTFSLVNLGLGVQLGH